MAAAPLKRRSGPPVAATSPDFVALTSHITVYTPSIRLAVATGSDTLEYTLPGQSRDTHLCGEDLASELIRRQVCSCACS